MYEQNRMNLTHAKLWSAMEKGESQPCKPRALCYELVHGLQIVEDMDVDFICQALLDMSERIWYPVTFDTGGINDV